MKKIPSKAIWAQALTLVLWFLITVIEWSQNPKSNPGFLVPAIIRGSEALSIFLVMVLFTWIFENIPVSKRKFWPRIFLLFALYPGALLANLLSLGIRALMGYSPPPLDGFFFFHSFHFYLPMLLVMVVYIIVSNQLEISLERENRLKAENLAQQARWMMFRYQVNPHFLFNALNTIRALIGENDEHARRAVTELSEYFRYSLTRDNSALVSMEQEINAVRSYLEIQKIRFGSRLDIVMDPDPGTLEFAVPVFAIQTLVENGIKYGLKTAGGVLHLRILSELRDDHLHISVANSGKLEKKVDPEDQGESSGTGLENLKERLAYLDPGSRFFLHEEDGIVLAQLFLTKKVLENEDLESTNNR